MDPLVWMYFATMSELPVEHRSTALLAQATPVPAPQPPGVRPRAWRYALLVALLLPALAAVV